MILLNGLYYIDNSLNSLKLKIVNEFIGSTTKLEIKINYKPKWVEDMIRWQQSLLLKVFLLSNIGRLLQVEYAINNINNAGLCVGLTTKEGVILAAEKESTSKLLERGRFSEKIYKIDTNIAVGVGGLAADANLLIDYAREYSQNYYFKYRANTPVENLVRYISDVKQIKTQFGSTRPYGAGFLFAGWDKLYGYQLYNTEPSGVYNCWKAHAIGQNSQNALSTLKMEYSEGMNLSDGLKFTVKVLKKTLDKNKLTGDNIDLFVIREKDGDLTQEFIDSKDIDEYLKVLNQEEESARKDRK